PPGYGGPPRPPREAGVRLRRARPPERGTSSSVPRPGAAAARPGHPKAAGAAQRSGAGPPEKVPDPFSDLRSRDLALHAGIEKARQTRFAGRRRQRGPLGPAAGESLGAARLERASAGQRRGRGNGPLDRLERLAEPRWSVEAGDGPQQTLGVGMPRGGEQL